MKSAHKNKFRHLAGLRFPDPPFRHLKYSPTHVCVLHSEKLLLQHRHEATCILMYYIYIFTYISSCMFATLVIFHVSAFALHRPARLSLSHILPIFKPPPSAHALIPLHTTTSPLAIGRRFWSSKRLLTLLRTPSARLYGWFLKSVRVEWRGWGGGRRVKNNLSVVLWRRLDVPTCSECWQHVSQSSMSSTQRKGPAGQLSHHRNRQQGFHFYVGKLRWILWKQDAPS